MLTGRPYGVSDYGFFGPGLAELEGVGIADGADRFPARRGAGALRPVPGRGGGRQRGHLHRSERALWTARWPTSSPLPSPTGAPPSAVSDALMRIHAKAKGIEPITGSRYSANNPEAQLWIHVTGWHSVLKCYERYGPGPLSDGRGVNGTGPSRVSPPNCRRCKPADVPCFTRRSAAVFRRRARTAVHVRTRRPRNALSARTTPRDRGVRLWAGSRVMAPAAIADPAGVDAAHGQLRPAGRGGRRRDCGTPSPRAWVIAIVDQHCHRHRVLVGSARRRALPTTAEVLASAPRTIGASTRSRSEPSRRPTVRATSRWLDA